MVGMLSLSRERYLHYTCIDSNKVGVVVLFGCSHGEGQEAQRRDHGLRDASRIRKSKEGIRDQ